MARTVLTDRFIKSRKPATVGARDDYADAIVPGLALRVTERGHRSFVLVARYPTNPKNPTRRALGEYGAITLDEARERARTWLGLIQRGVDPRTQEARATAATRKQQLVTFGVVAEQFLQRHAAGLRSGGDIRTLIEQEFVKPWRDWPAADVSPVDVADAVRAIVNRGAPYQAHNAFAYLRRLYNWAIGTHEFGLTVSPVTTLRPSDLIGKREARERILADGELKSVWDASTSTADGMGYPYGPLIRLLILTGLREKEVAAARWQEIDLDGKLWTIPAARMKGGRAHEVPLAPEALALLKSLPRFAGDYVFTTDGGKKPVNGFGKAKTRIDKLSKVDGWRFHDLRRTMRTHLSALPVQDMVRELVIAHARPGLHKVYDQHSYQAEKRRCLGLWEKRLADLLAPKRSADVVPLWQAQQHEGRI